MTLPALILIATIPMLISIMASRTLRTRARISAAMADGKWYSIGAIYMLLDRTVSLEIINAHLRSMVSSERAESRTSTKTSHAIMLERGLSTDAADRFLDAIGIEPDFCPLEYRIKERRRDPWVGECAEAV